jgi:hypothetical protein
MNREQAKKLLPIIQAFADGAEIQYRRDDGRWSDWSSPNFTPSLDVRIKPKPREKWFAVDAEDYVINSIFNSEEEARGYVERSSVNWDCIKAPFTYIRMREVIE